MHGPSFGRRQLLQGLCALGAGALGAGAVAPRARSATPLLAADWCGPPEGAPLLVPGDAGWLGRLAPRDAPFTLATSTGLQPDTPWPAWYAVTHRGRAFRNPTLAVERGERVRVTLANTLAEPTIVHWHGLANDTANDGAGLTVAAPGGRYAYDFTVRERAGLYWYHPHAHGLVAGQAYRGLFGLIAVDDVDDRALRAALDVAWGTTEIALVLQDRRHGPDYAPGAADRHHGFLGTMATVNGGVSPHHDVATRAYRFRILNASNARSYRLGFADAAGAGLPFTLLGTDGGLLAAPVRCTDCFVASAERIDVLLDLSGTRVGDTVVLETREFDPMHFEPPATPAGAAAGEAAHPHAAARAGASATTPADAADAPWPEGAPRALLRLRVRERVAWRGTLPARLSTVADIDVAGARERPLRLGFAKGRWRINDRVFAMGETPIEVARDTTEVWLLRNYFASMPHAMHVHGFHFRVLERETSPDAIAALAVDATGRLPTDLGWKDTVLVWPGESVRIALRFALPFVGPQTYMVHCHNLEHEDGGMMLGMRVA